MAKYAKVRVFLNQTSAKNVKYSNQDKLGNLSMKLQTINFCSQSYVNII